MDEFTTSEPGYQPQIDPPEDNSNHNQQRQKADVHLDIDNRPHVMGITPRAPRQEVPLPTIEAIENFKPHSDCSVSNIIWAILVGWWVSLFYVITGLLFFLTVYAYKHGIYCFKMASYIIFPFGRYATTNSQPAGPENFVTKALWILFFPIYGIGSILGMVISWELTYYIPMSKFLLRVLKFSFQQPTKIDIVRLQNHNPQQGKYPTMMTHSSGAGIYFRFTLFSFEVPYLNMTPFIIIALICGFIGHTGTFIDDPIFGSCVAMIGAIPCAYLIGICVDDLSHQLGLIIGAILNSFFLAIVELILYYFSLRKSDLADAVRSAITGAFLMNLLIIPGVGMFAAGLKWNEIVLNRKSQSISGTLMMIAVVAVLFPSIFYHIHAGEIISCDQCNIGNMTSFENVSCSLCHPRELNDIESDPIYKKYAEPLMWVMTALMPIIYFLGVFFSLKTHAHLFVYETHEEGEPVGMNKWIAIVVLAISTVGFSLMAHVMTDKIPEAIERMKLSPRFVGLVFYTLIPNAAEYMNAIKFAINGNIGLSMEIGNQGATLTSMVELPILVLMSFVLHKFTNTILFTLIFPVIDICSILIAVVLRNSILTEKSVNYFTGISFLIIFLLISIVYYFELSDL
ncbi:Sodium/calcium exchanger protein [Tritrichomonas foetus]|uniref:Sodium/calcium exchanger protein n=1 Tax=Tritrichomonas foetus TaxID=1144522 RepID=A0A1J4K4M8_9EUKA|nr:Sodium/calcium exchanger protein [Tritrichomonas foetus]|eukprot:OHT04453.1 Sodium/calcium exchanger protein [Tritrichomonas foetus]